MNEAPIERPAKPAGLEKVLHHSIYSNWKIPQTGIAVAAGVMNALLTEPDPRSVLQEYLGSSLDPKAAEAFLQNANLAHMKHLPEGERPDLNPERLERLWESEQATLTQALYETLVAPGARASRPIAPREREAVVTYLQENDLPVEALRIAPASILKSIRRPDIAADLEAYRTEFESGDWRNNPRIPPLLRQALDKILDALDADISSATVDTAIARRWAEFLRRDYEQFAGRHRAAA